MRALSAHATLPIRLGHVIFGAQRTRCAPSSAPDWWPEAPRLPRRRPAATMAAFHAELIHAYIFSGNRRATRRAHRASSCRGRRGVGHARLFRRRQALPAGQHVEIAKAMFNVGVQMAGRMTKAISTTMQTSRAFCTERSCSGARPSLHNRQRVLVPAATQQQTNVQALRPAQAGGVAQLAACRVVDLAEAS